jgi:hypothetical protein
MTDMTSMMDPASYLKVPSIAKQIRVIFKQILPTILVVMATSRHKIYFFTQSYGFVVGSDIMIM